MKKIILPNVMDVSGLCEVISNLPSEYLPEIENAVERKKLSRPIPENTYLTVIQVCRYLKISRQTAWRYSKAGILKPFRLGNKVLYARADIDDFLKNGMSHEEQ